MASWECTIDSRPAWELWDDAGAADVGGVRTQPQQPVARSVIVLSPDADEVLTTLDKDTLYVVPGVIDRTVTSEISLSLARKHGFRARRLPIQEYIPKRQTHVLNIDTVMKIFCLYAEHEGDWKTVLETALPKRKQQQRRLGVKRAAAAQEGEESSL